MKKDIYTVSDVANELGVSTRAVRKLIREKKLIAALILGKYLITAENFKGLVDKKLNQ